VGSLFAGDIIGEANAGPGVPFEIMDCMVAEKFGVEIGDELIVRKMPAPRIPRIIIKPQTNTQPAANL
jgi:hypothetical protein